MIHRILTCRNHRHLRWSCKDIAWSGHYNGSRNIFFNGVPTGKGMFHDLSGLDCDHVVQGEYIGECTCSPSDLILAPEDEYVSRYREKEYGKTNHPVPAINSKPMVRYKLLWVEWIIVRRTPQGKPTYKVSKKVWYKRQWGKWSTKPGRYGKYA